MSDSEENESEQDQENQLDGGAGAFDTFSEWACLQPQESLKEVFGGAEFVAYRYLLRDIAKTIAIHKPFRNDQKNRRCSTENEFYNPIPLYGPRNKPWARIAMRAGDVIMIGPDRSRLLLDESDHEQDDDENENELEGREDDEMEGERLQYYSGYKFRQYMTSDTPEGEPSTEKKMSYKSFEIVMMADLTDEGFDPIRLCSFAEVDAFRGDEPIELKSSFEREGFMSKLHTYLHCNFGHAKSFVTGIRDEDYITRKVFERKTVDLEGNLSGRSDGESPEYEKCYSFLYDILSMTKHILTRSKACRLVYLPKSGIIQFEPITEDEADRRGYRFSEKFREKFRID